MGLMLWFWMMWLLFCPKEVGKTLAKIMIEYEKEMKKLKGKK